MTWGLHHRALLWTTGATALVLLLGNGFLVWVLQQQLSGTFDDDLNLKSRSAASAVESWMFEQHRLPSAPFLGGETSYRLRSVFTPRTDVPSDQPTMLSLLDTQGQTVLSSHQPASGKLPPLGVHRGKAFLADSSSEVEEYRVMTNPVHLRGVTVGYVRALAPVKRLKQTLSRIESALVTSAIGLLILNVWLVGLALRRALRPIDRLVSDIHRVTERNLSVRVPVPHSDDEIQRLAETFNAMLDRLDRGFRFQTQLFQDLSHQLKTPLAVLTGSLETTLRRARTAEEYQSILESNLDEVGRMTHLIESLLLLARLDSQNVQLQFHDVDFVQFCQTWAQDISLLWEAKGLETRWTDDGPLPVLIDPGRMVQPLLNLVDNAVKYSPEGGFLTFRFRREGGLAIFELENEGPALVEGSEEEIFVRFTSDQESGRGFGLGLPIARAAVELHGGSLVAYHPPVQGAGFRLSLPLRP